jgi:hypothetical protein
MDSVKNRLIQFCGADFPFLDILHDTPNDIERIRTFLSDTRAALLADISNYPATLPLRDLYTTQTLAANDPETRAILDDIVENDVEKAAQGKWKSAEGILEMKTAIQRCR